MTEIYDVGAIIAERDRLLKERSELLQQIERTVDEQKPTIPKKVAIAIGICKLAGMSGISIVTSMEHVQQLFRDYDQSILNALETIKSFAWHTIGGGQDLLAALVNGYTVEEG